jgi:hypothetical protein
MNTYYCRIGANYSIYLYKSVVSFLRIGKPVCSDDESESNPDSLQTILKNRRSVFLKPFALQFGISSAATRAFVRHGFRARLLPR